VIDRVRKIVEPDRKAPAGVIVCGRQDFEDRHGRSGSLVVAAFWL
jgi:hypothetical protein